MEDQVIPTEVPELGEVNFDEVEPISDFDFISDEADPKADEKLDSDEVVEDKKDGEESEETAEEAPAVDDFKAKMEEAEKRSAKAMRKLKESSDRLKAAEAHIAKLSGEGINAEIAVEVAVAKKSGNYGKAFKLLGLDPDAIVTQWAKDLGWNPEQEDAARAHMKSKMVEEDRQKVESERTRVARQDATMRGQAVVRKYAEKLPLLATAEDEGVDLMIAKVQELSSKKDPRLTGLNTWEEAFKAVAPIVEKELYKKYSKMYEPLSKLKGKGKQEQPKPEEKVEKKEPKKVEPKGEQEKKPQSKTIKGGAGGGAGTASRKPRNEIERLKQLTADLDFR
jgi:hypothetical protein